MGITHHKPPSASHLLRHGLDEALLPLVVERLEDEVGAEHGVAEEGLLGGGLGLGPGELVLVEVEGRGEDVVLSGARL